jgi:predicted ATPase/transcriptional regulator with XRE-family HTH domain
MERCQDGQAVDQDASFGRLLRRLRKTRDLTQEALAQQAYCAVDTIKKIEAGVRRPSRQLAAQFADCLELEGDERTAFLAAARPIARYEIDIPAETIALAGRSLAPGAPHGRDNLPHHPTPLIGRAQELDGLARLLADAQVRLVTITGPGGIGKTRLATALAEQLLVAERFPDGVFFVPLAPIEATERIVPALAEALEFPLDAGQQPARSPRQQVLDYLHSKRLALVLDNVEHLLRDAETGAADLISGVLDTAAGVAILATSRERLKLREEHLYPLGGLEVPGAEAPESYGAVALFVQRARLLRPDFAPTADDQGVIARICHLVEGMPLAIELAAGWIDTLALSDIAAEIDRGLDVLATELRDVPVRHRNMRAVFDATWQRLGAAEQAVFARFSVLRGGGTRGAVQAVIGATLPQLHALVGASLLYYDTRRDRYTVHELLRQYAAEKLAADTADEATARDRHAAYYCGLLHELKADLQGGRQREALAAIEADGENARAAWEWAAQRQNVALLDQAIDSLGHFYEWQGRAEEGVAAFGAAAAALATSPGLDAQRVRARILAWQSWCAHLLGDSAAGALLAQSQGLLDGLDRTDIDTRAERAFVLLHAAQLASHHDFPAARATYEQSRALFQALGDRWGEATALFGLGHATRHLAGDYDLAQHWLEQSLALRRALDDRLGIVETLTVLSHTARYLGHVAESERLAREGYDLALGTGNRLAIARAASNLGMAVNWSPKNYAEANRLGQEALTIYTDLGDRLGLMDASVRLSIAQMYLGRYADARATLEEHQRMAQTLGMPIAAGAGLQLLASVALAEGGYAEAQRLIGQAISGLTTIGERWHRSHAHSTGALAERALGNRQGTWGHTVAALRLGLEIHAWLVVVHALRAAALLLADDAERERAVELYALAERENPRDDALAMARWGRELAAVAAALPAEAAAAAQARGQARDLWATARELLTELESAGWGAEMGD